LLYGSGLRLMECVRLRVHDVEFSRREILVRNGKGGKDRVTMLPDPLVEPLQRRIEHMRSIHESDLELGLGAVYLPNALARKYPNAALSFGSQYIFSSRTLSSDPRSDRKGRGCAVPSPL